MQQDNKSKVIAAFDFDGTITTKDTLFDFLIFYFGRRKLLAGLFVLSPILVLYKMGIIKNNVAKEKLFSYFFKNKKYIDFINKCEEYKTRIDQICKNAILDKIKWHQEQDHTVIIISASISDWIKPWALKIGIDYVLGTEIEIKDNHITGKFASPNCYGQEKVNRLLSLYPDKDNYILYAYGDSRGDKELLEYSDHPTLLKN